MANGTSAFYDSSLICSKNHKPINLSAARIETKTFIELLRTHADLSRFGILGPAVNYFFDVYDEAIIKIAEVEGVIKDPEVFRAQTSHMNSAAIEEYQMYRLEEWGRRQESIRMLIEELQKNLYDAAIRYDNSSFTKLLDDASTELKEKVDCLYELIG